MRLITYRRTGGGQWRSGALVDDKVVDGAALGWPLSIRDLLAAGVKALEDSGSQAAELAETPTAFPLAEVIIGPAVLDPSKILCVGLNYAAHIAEAGRERPEYPEIFTKFANTLIGPNDDIIVPSAAVGQVDYEGELAVVIGTPARRLTADNALDHVAGYAVFNDVSARDLQLRVSQWTMGKSVDTFGPIGPITLRRDIADVQQLTLTTTVNGDVRQHANTSSMLNTVVDILVYITGVIALEPGDVIATGTPEGVGIARDPQRFLLPGDIVEVEIEKLGRICNRVTFESTGK